MDRRIKAQLMRRVDDEYAVELEPWRLRVYVANTCEKQRGHKLPVRQTAVQLLGQGSETLLARRLFDQPHDRFDVRSQLDDVRSHTGIRSSHWG